MCGKRYIMKNPCPKIIIIDCIINFVVMAVPSLNYICCVSIEEHYNTLFSRTDASNRGKDEK